MSSPIPFLRSTLNNHAPAYTGKGGPAPTASETPAAHARSAPIIAICHLSWHWVWQRPQQFLSRFAKRHPVLFVETYFSDVSATGFELSTAKDQPNVTLLQIHLPASRSSDGAYIDAERRRILKKILADELENRFNHAILWFNDPMAVTAYAGQLKESLIVYDCMDELSQFKGAHPELLARERELLRMADVVFCGGQKMREKRLPLNPNTYFFGTGVDCAHFGKARSSQLAVTPEVADFKGGPVLGYFGVIDERLDYELLAKLADARPDWNIVMVGPTAKVDPAQLPNRQNLHWIGARPYDQLPALTKGFSVCMMPFALNAATEYINPTKALEYMAAGKPVVSTALDEVRMNFGAIAHIAPSHEAFIKMCDQQVSSPFRLRIMRGLNLASGNTWEAIVAKMEDHIAEALIVRSGERPSEAPAGQKSLPVSNLAYV